MSHRCRWRRCRGAGELMLGVSGASGVTGRALRAMAGCSWAGATAWGYSETARARLWLWLEPGSDGEGVLGVLGGDGEEAGARAFEGGDVVDVTHGQADVVEAFHEPPAGVVVDLERRLDPGR